MKVSGAKRFVILATCLASQFVASSLWAWPPGLRSSSSFFRGLFGPEYSLVSFGDSVASGFNSQFWLSRVKGGTYADHFGKWFNEENDRTIRVRNIAWAGFTLSEILGAIRKSHVSRIKGADMIFLEGGGNDFLDLYGQKFIDLCKPENFYPTLEGAKKNFLSMMADVTKNKKAGAKVRVVGMYYPLVNKTRVRACELKALRVAPTVHAAFLNALSKFNWYLRSESKKRGFVFVDTFAHMNCARSNWSKCKITNASSESAYTEKLFELDAKKYLRDPMDLGILQKDGVHPNTEGHALMAWTIQTAQ